MARSTGKKASKKGLSVKSFKGLSKKRMESKGSKNAGKRMMIKQGDTIPVQFLTTPDDFQEFEIHNFQEDGRWEYVPCLGEDCPLCEDEDSSKSRTSYRFACVVYNLKERKVQILEGPKDLAGRIFYRYERAPAKFLKRTFEITKFPTTPVTYDVSLAEEALVKTTTLKLHDLDEYLVEEAKRYYGDDLPEASALDAEDDDDLDEDEDDEDDEDEDDDLDDDDDDEDDDEDEDDEDEDDEDEDEDDDDDDDEDEEDDDDEDDEDEDEDDEPEPPKKSKKAASKKSAPAKKTAAKKAPAKKAASKKGK